MPLGPQDSVLSEQLVHLLHREREICTLGEAAPKKKVACVAGARPSLREWCIGGEEPRFRAHVLTQLAWGKSFNVSQLSRGDEQIHHLRVVEGTHVTQGLAPTDAQ